MLRSERLPLHHRIAETLTTKFVDVAEGAPEVVAYHYSQAREITLAISYWLKAARQASRRSAFMEAMTHIQTALKLLDELSQDRTRLELELQLQQSLANASIAANGFGASETLVAFTRALALCKEVGNASQIFAILNGLVGAHLMRGEIQNARTVAQDLLALAAEGTDTTGLLMGHRVLGMSLFMLGELTQSKHELQDAIALYDPEQHAPLALVFAHDFKATAQVYLGVATALSGDAEAGIAHAQAALTYAEELRHPHSICYVLPFLAGTYLVAGNPRAAIPVTDQAIAQSKEHGFPQWVAGALMLRAWAHLELGELESGFEDVRNSITELQKTGTLIWMQFSHYLLARALAEDGQLQEASDIVDRLLREFGASGGRWYEAEVHRLRGDILRVERKPLAEVAACYKAAAALAHRQGAKMWELRAAQSLAALAEDSSVKLQAANTRPS
jgi:predicted ATPase